MTKKLLIHNNNIEDKSIFDTTKKFSSDSNNLDENISRLIQDIQDIDYDIIYIKDNLSFNYLELYGLRVAFHIRLSEGTNQYTPIVILSDIDSHTLNKFDSMARILFTKNVFVIKNTKKAIEEFDQFSKFSELTKENYKESFLNLITIEPPENSTNHSIANEWAIYKWAKELKLDDSNAVNTILANISSQLFFKYLKSKHEVIEKIKIDENKPLAQATTKIKIVSKTKQTKKKVLYIDDEYKKGWKDIFDRYFLKQKTYEFNCLQIEYKDKTYDEIEPLISEEIIRYEPDLIILDMRLIQNDQEENINPANISGIKILEIIKNKSLDNKINSAIQVIILSATGRSDILEEAYMENKILGYIKKDHIDDKVISTSTNLDKLSSLIKDGEDKFYLKNILNIQKATLKLDIFHSSKYNEIKKEVSFIFEILDSNMENNLKFTMLTIYKILEIIKDLFIDDNAKYLIQNNEEIPVVFLKDGTYKSFIKNTFIDNYRINSFNERKDAGKYYYSTTNKIKVVMFDILNITDKKFLNMIDNISQKRNKYIHPDQGREIIVEKTDIVEWLKLVQTIVSKF